MLAYSLAKGDNCKSHQQEEKLNMRDNKPVFFAHTNGSSDPKDWQPLKEHLQNTANLVFREFSSHLLYRRPYGK